MRKRLTKTAVDNLKAGSRDADVEIEVEVGREPVLSKKSADQR